MVVEVGWENLQVGSWVLQLILRPPSRHDCNVGASVFCDHSPCEEGRRAWKEVEGRALGDKPS